MSTDQPPVESYPSHLGGHGRMLTLSQSDLQRNGRFLVIGDIHGQYDMLIRLLDYCRHNPSDRVICLGDLIDRGDDSLKVVQHFWVDRQFHSLLGNHEAMMLSALQDFQHRRIWRNDGGFWADGVSADDLDFCQQVFLDLPLAGELLLNDGRRIGLVHAELPIESHWDDVRTASMKPEDWFDHYATTLPASLIWGRRRVQVAVLGTPKLHPEMVQAKGVDLMIAGHSVIYNRQPLHVGNCLWIDTGAYWGGPLYSQLPAGRLTAVDPVAGQYWQVGRGAGEAWGPLPLPEGI